MLAWTSSRRGTPSGSSKSTGTLRHVTFKPLLLSRTDSGEVYRQGHDPATVAVAPTPKKTVRMQFRRSHAGKDCES